LSQPFSSHRARKRFGQHWLIDERVLQQIVAAAQLSGADTVLEVGPGRGALTAQLLASPAAGVRAIELDRDLIAGLQSRFAADPRFELFSGDVLELELPEATKVVANIPYNITGPLLERLVGRLDRPAPCSYRRLVLLVQQEVGERIRARPGSSSYSALSVRMQLLCQTQLVCAVPPRCFDPPPKVQSEVICLEPLPQEQRLPAELARGVEALLKRCFAARRKMLRNTLQGLAAADQLERLAVAGGFELQQRPQEIAPQAWVALAEGLNQLQHIAATEASHG